MADAAVSLRSVVKRFGRFTAVDRLDVEIPTGRTFGLLGPNGAGKTTTIRMIMNITRPDEGEIRVLGRPMDEALQERIGYLPEERGLYPKMKVRDQLLFLAEALERLGPWIEKMELAPWMKRKTEELSKGMQQKVQFLQTIVHDPEILILDEPFSGLDPINVVLIKDFLEEFKQRNRTVIFSTHVLEQAERLCDEVLVLYRSKPILRGTVEQIQNDWVDRVPPPPPRPPLPELEKIFVQAVQDAGFSAPRPEELE